jgi:hypothetical protein
VRRDQDGHPGTLAQQIAQRPLQVLARVGVEARGRLVEDQELGAVRQARDQSELDPRALGERADLARAVEAEPRDARPRRGRPMPRESAR